MESSIEIPQELKVDMRARFGSTYTKIGTIQRRLAWPLRKDDTQIREAFHVFQNQGGGWRWGREGGLDGVGWRDGEKRHTTVIE